MAMLLVLASATAQSQEIVSAKVGIQGKYKVGLWTPVTVVLRGGQKNAAVLVHASTADNDGLPCDVASAEPVQLLPGRELSVELYARFASASPTLDIRLADGQRTIAERSFAALAASKDDGIDTAIEPEQKLAVQVGLGATGLEEATAMSKITISGSDNAGPRTATVRVASLDQLPTRAIGYEAVDEMLIATSRLQTFEHTSASGAQIEALDAWVHSGGKLVICVGTQAARALAASSPLARFCPGKFERMVSQTKAAAWETYAKAPNSVPRNKSGKVDIEVAQLAGVGGPNGRAGSKIESVESDLPLVIRTPRGLGQVIFVAADLDIGPLSQWSDRHLLIAALLDMPTNVAILDSNENSINSSYSDLAGQLRYALDDYSQVTTVPFSVVAILIIVYILLIGPGDYFLLRRFNRMHWTWITFPAVVLLFCAGSYFSAYLFKGRQIRVNEVDLIDVDAEGASHGATWVNLFSPHNDTFDLSLKPRLPGGESPPSAELTFAWLGTAGNAAGGMYRRGRGQSQLGSESYSLTPDLEEVLGVPIQVWSTKCFVARWRAPKAALPIESNLTTDDSGLPMGHIINRTNLTLEHCLLVHDRWLYAVGSGSLSPGGSVDFGGNTRRVGLDSLFGSQSGVISDAIVDRNNFFEQGTRAPARVLSAMMFYEAADGRKCAHLANDYQSFVDLSGVLKTGQAVLVGRPKFDASFHGPQLQRDGKPLPGTIDQRTVMFRFVLSVAEKSANR